MIEEARCLKVKELERELEKLEIEYAAMYDLRDTIYGQLHLLRYVKRKVEEYQSQEHSFFDRFTKRKEYLAYKANLETLKSYPEKESVLESRLVHAEDETYAMVTSSGIEKKIEDKKKEIEQVKAATTLEQLGMNAMEVVEILQNHGVTPTWGDGDYQLYSQMHDSENQQEIAMAKSIDEVRYQNTHKRRLHKCTVGTYAAKLYNAEQENI